MISPFIVGFLLMTEELKYLVFKSSFEYSFYNTRNTLRIILPCAGNSMDGPLDLVLLAKASHGTILTVFFSSEIAREKV